MKGWSLEQKVSPIYWEVNQIPTFTVKTRCLKFEFGLSLPESFESLMAYPIRDNTGGHVNSPCQSSCNNAKLLSSHNLRISVITSYKLDQRTQDIKLCPCL